jgi:hypothetical protein
MLDDIRDIRAVNYYTTKLQQNEDGEIVIVKEFVKYELQVLRNWTFAKWEPIKVIEVDINQENDDV